jgi:hypothetical protein
VPGRSARKEGGADKSGAAAEAETLSNLLGADGRGRFSGTMFSSELARHGGHCLRSLHRGGALARAAPTDTATTSVLEANAPPPRASARAMSAPPPPPEIPTIAHAAAATHARRSACDDTDTPAGACGLRAPAEDSLGGAGGPRQQQQQLIMVVAVEEAAIVDPLEQ